MFSRRLKVAVSCAGLVLAQLMVGGCSKGGSGPTDPSEPGNHAPTLNVAADSTRILISGICTIRATASDADGDQLSYTYSAEGGTVEVSGATATTATFTATALGNASVTVTVSDGHGGETTAAAAIYVVRSGSPAITSTFYTCSWRAVPSESLLVVSAEVQYPDTPYHYEYATINGAEPPVLVRPSAQFFVASTQDCSEALVLARLRVQRPLPDGRCYDITLRH